MAVVPLVSAVAVVAAAVVVVVVEVGTGVPDHFESVVPAVELVSRRQSFPADFLPLYLTLVLAASQTGSSLSPPPTSRSGPRQAEQRHGEERAVGS